MRTIKPIRLHWASSKPNFGDMLSPMIVERVSGRPVRLCSIRRCDLVAIGSLMQRLRKRFARPAHIWGAGFIDASFPRRARHRIHALRGPETAALLGREPGSQALGDPALLAGMLDEGLLKRRRRYRLTVIPHYKDRDSQALARLKVLNPDARVLDVFDDPMDVLNAIAESQLVLSSAMHGLIAADALNVPNCRVRLSDNLRGGDFKFRDYYGVFGMSPPEVEIDVFNGELFERCVEEYHRPGLEHIQVGLVEAFPSDL